jgi:hypothetical protein
MADYRCVPPKLYSFQVPEKPQIHIPIPASPRLIQGVEITNKLPAKQGPVPTAPVILASSFLITNTKPPQTKGEDQVLPPIEDEEDQGFPYDDQSGMLLGSAQAVKPVKEATTPSIFPTSVDPIQEIRKNAKAKVQNWLRNSEEKRARGLDLIAKNYKK